MRQSSFILLFMIVIPSQMTRVMSWEHTFFVTLLFHRLEPVRLLVKWSCFFCRILQSLYPHRESRHTKNNNTSIPFSILKIHTLGEKTVCGNYKINLNVERQVTTLKMLYALIEVKIKMGQPIKWIVKWMECVCMWKMRVKFLKIRCID